MSENTEEKILKAAENLFIEKGFNKTQLKDIAQSAGVNPASLHYYFRNKELLFQRIAEKYLSLITKSFEILDDKELSFFEKIEKFIKKSYELYQNNRKILAMILSQNSEELKSLLQKHKTTVKKLHIYEQLKTAKDLKMIKDVDPEQFIIQMITLCFFPIINYDFVSSYFFEPSEWETFINDYFINLPATLRVMLTR